MIEKKARKAIFYQKKNNFSIKNDKGDFNSRNGIPPF